MLDNFVIHYLISFYGTQSCCIPGVVCTIFLTRVLGNKGDKYPLTVLLQYLLFFLFLETLKIEDDDVLKDELMERLQFWRDGHSRSLLIKPGTQLTSPAFSQHRPLSKTSASSFWKKIIMIPLQSVMVVHDHLWETNWYV